MASEERPQVKSETLAKLCNITTRRVEQLAKDGIMVKRERGLYDLWGSVASYIRFLQEASTNQWGSDSPDLNEVRKKKMELECKRIEFALDVEKGKYVRRVDVIEEGFRVGTVLKQVMMRLENDLPPMLEGLKAAKMKPKLRDYSRNELVELEGALGEAVKEEGEDE
jgi:phage terminase Nu1 subunit (DNA packaging protein)